jgi:hypothetical protein
MGRAWKIGIAAAVVVIVALAVNALLVGARTEKAEVTVPGGRILDVPGGELQVIDRGPGRADPIVLIHCFTCAIDWWDGMLPRLEATHRVVAVDLLGHGRSPSPSRTRSSSTA